MDHRETMDRIYRFQRHLYDVTRPLFLFGRNALLDKMDIQGEMRVLEMGCGTARNLLRLAQRHGQIRCFGVDISSEMLRTARRNVEKAGLSNRIVLKEVPAESLDRATFGLDASFERIFFSYTLSMMPFPKSAIEAAMGVLADDGELYVVDFWDGNGWPKPVQAAMKRWLGLFHVQFNDDIVQQVQALCPTLQIRSIGRRYGFLAHP